VKQPVSIKRHIYILHNCTTLQQLQKRSLQTVYQTFSKMLQSDFQWFTFVFYETVRPTCVVLENDQLTSVDLLLFICYQFARVVQEKGHKAGFLLLLIPRLVHQYAVFSCIAVFIQYLSNFATYAW